MDPKQIGLAAKDIVAGIGAAIAGATAGPGAAQAVMTASSGIDRLIEAIVPSPEEKPRAQRFDNQDFHARPRPKPAAQPAASSGPREPADKPRGEAQQVSAHLRTLGWSDEEIQAVLSGPKALRVRRGAPEAVQDEQDEQDAQDAQDSPAEQAALPRAVSLLSSERPGATLRAAALSTTPGGTFSQAPFRAAGQEEFVVLPKRST